MDAFVLSPKIQRALSHACTEERAKSIVVRHQCQDFSRVSVMNIRR